MIFDLLRAIASSTALNCFSSSSRLDDFCLDTFLSLADGMLVSFSLSSSLGGEMRFLDISTFLRVGTFSFCFLSVRPRDGPFDPDVEPDEYEEPDSDSLESDDPTRGKFMNN